MPGIRCERHMRTVILSPPPPRDHNPSSRQAKDALHGTSMPMSVVQLPARDTSIPDPDNCVDNNRAMP